MQSINLAEHSVRELNQLLHNQAKNLVENEWEISETSGQHNIACGLNQKLKINIQGHVGYFCAGMNQHADVTVQGNAGQGVAENMMSGTVHVKGDASSAAGATSHGGLLVVDGNTGARCGISMKGSDIVVKGNVGHMSCFMAQAGTLVVCGDAGEALGDSLYETVIYVQGKVQSLGADCIEKPVTKGHLKQLKALLALAGAEADPTQFKRYGSARQLYNFKVDNAY